MKVDSSLVTLVEVGVGHRADGELWGGLVVRRKDSEQTKLYAQFLPQATNMTPPGWGSIAELTGVTAEQVAFGWDALGVTNEVAAHAFELLREHVGRDFLARELDGVGDERALDLIPIRIDDPTLKLDLTEGEVVFGNAHIQFTPVLSLSPEVDVNNIEAPRLVLLTEHAAPYVFEVPDVEHNSDPWTWFFVETFTGVAASKIANSWVPLGAQKQNVQLLLAMRELAKLLTGRFVPMTSQGTVDIDALRRALVQELAKTKLHPFVFLGRNPQRTIERAWILMKDAIGPHLFRYNVERGANSGLPAIIRVVDGQQKLEVIDSKEKMRGILFSFIDFASSTKTQAIRHVVPPNVISEHMIIFADQTVPAIDTLTRIPTIRRDGTIHDQEGYDPRSRIWYAPELNLEAIPTLPTERDVREAVATVVAPFVDFPFVEESGGRSAVIACLLEQIVRPMIHGPRPLYAFDAPAIGGQGTGKSICARAVGSIITGREIDITPWPEDPKDLPKLITSRLLASDPFVIFDNLEGPVKHKDLAACATTTMWSSRLLHSNDSPKLPQTATWCMTLNGARFSRDIARRTITIKLDARSSDPSRRTGWKIPNLLHWCLQNRARVIRACLILARAWAVAGHPADARLVAGSFEAWQVVVGGILAHAGLRDLPLALEESRGREVDSNEHEIFVLHWYEHYRDSPQTAATLAQLAELYNLYGAILENVKAANWKGRHMAEVLRKLKGHTFGNWQVECCEARMNGQFVYQLKAAYAD